MADALSGLPPPRPHSPQRGSAPRRAAAPQALVAASLANAPPPAEAAVAPAPPESVADVSGHERLVVNVARVTAHVIASEHVRPPAPLPAYWVYTVELAYFGFRWTVTCRMRDFLRLHARLVLTGLRAGYRLPSFPRSLLARGRAHATTSDSDGDGVDTSAASPNAQDFVSSLASSRTSVDEHPVTEAPADTETPEWKRSAQERLEAYMAGVLALPTDERSRVRRAGPPDNQAAHAGASFTRQGGSSDPRARGGPSGACTGHRLRVFPDERGFLHSGIGPQAV